jgi:hypothetical protein
MIKNKRVFIVSGGTSFFSVGCLIPTLCGVFEDIKIILNIRSESKNKVTVLNTLAKNSSLLLNYDMSEEDITIECKLCDYVFYLSSNFNHDILKVITNECLGNVCVFGAAVIYSEDENVKETTYYQEKRATMNFLKGRKAIFVVPGFFLQNIHVPEYTPKGLHSETFAKLLKRDDKLSSKYYNVTPLSTLVNFCVNLVMGKDSDIPAKDFKNGKPLCIMSRELYERKELLLQDELVYKVEEKKLKGLVITLEDVKSAINEIKRIHLF